MARQQMSNMAALQGINDNTGDILYKNFQHEVHQVKVYELK